MSDWLWRYRGPVVFGLAALTTVLLLQLAGRAPSPPTPPEPPAPRPETADGFASGRVTRSDGRALVDATVCAHCDAPDCPRGYLGVPQCTTTGPAGRWQLGPMPRTLFGLTATASGHVFGSGPERLDLRAGGVGGLDVVLGPGGAELRGTVVDADGHPVAGALVSRLAGHFPNTSTITDARGEFLLWVREGEARLEVKARDFATRILVVTAPGVLPAVTLRAGASVRGRVVRATDGTPMPGAHVGVADDHWRRHRAAAVSDADGRFELPGLAAGRYTPYASSAGWYGDGDSVIVGPFQTAQVDLVVHPARTVTGRVWVGDHPCSRGSIRLAHTGDSSIIAEAPLDRDGRAVLSPVLPGAYRATVRCAGATTPTGPEVVEVAERDVDDLVWRARPGATARGVVVTARNEPLAGVRVVARQHGTTRSTTTAGDGTFALSGLERGPARLHAEVLGTAISGDVAAEAGGPPARLLALAPGGLALRVVDDDSGEPLAGLEVSVAGHFSGTGADGRLMLEHLTPGDYTVTVGHPVGGRVLREGWVLGGARQRVTIEEDEITSMTIRVAGLVGVIEGRVLDADGNPVADATVIPSYRGAAWEAPEEHVLMREHAWRAVTGADGSFALSRLIPGAYDLCATHHSGGLGCVEAVGTRERATITLAPAGSIAGTVTDATGTPVLDLILSARETNRGLERVQRFLHRSSFLLDNLPPGTWELTAESSLGAASLTVSLAPREKHSNLAIELEPYASVVGRLLTLADGEPVTDVEVSIWPETSAAVGVRRAVTDDAGRYSFDGVPVGRADLRVRVPPGYVDFFDRVLEVPASGELDATRLVRSPGEPAGMFGFRPRWPPDGASVSELRIVVEDVKPDSPAGLAGLRIGDAIIAIDGVSIAGGDHYMFWGLIAATPGMVKTVTLADGRQLTMTAGELDWP